MSAEAGWLWAMTPGLPLALALGLLVPGLRGPVMRLAWIGALPLLGLALFAPGGSSVQLDALLFGSELRIDDTSRPFALLTACVWIAASIYAWSYLREPMRTKGLPGRARYFAFHLVTMSGNAGVTLAGDVASFYLFFAVMTFASYGLIVHEHSEKAHHAGLVYLVLAIFGEALLAAGIMIVLAAGGAMRFAEPSGLAASPHGGLGFALLLAGFGVKAGMLPLHVWLPLAYRAAPTPASAVLSGSLSAAGLLGWLRFLPLGIASGAPWVVEWAGPCIGIGLAGALGAAVLGVLQRDPKVLLAYSSISQMGWMMTGLGIALASGPANARAAVLAVSFFALHHGLAKAALFLSVGVAGRALLHGRRHALLRLGVVVSALVVAGAPGTSGALAKSRLETLVAALPWPPHWIEHGLELAVVGTAALMARFIGLMWSRQTTADTSEIPARGAAALWLPWCALVLLSLALVPILDVLLPGLVAGLDPGPPKISLRKLAPIGAGALLVVALLRTRLADKSVPAGDLLWLLLPGLRSVRAQSALHASRLKAWRHALGRFLSSEGGAGPTRSQLLARIEAALEPWAVLAVLLIVSASLLIARALLL